MNAIHSADIFCKVIDNFGDAGVCWRLARALARSGLAVRLWIDNVQRLQCLRPALDTSMPEQTLDGFTVVRWDDAAPIAYEPADLVIEAFACRMPDAMLDVLARAEPRRVWINLEYLSAESWVRESHALPSPHPRLPLTQYFYFPGFEQGTGGLLCEKSLPAARGSFDAQERARCLARLGVFRQAPASDELLVSLFCYPQAPVESLLRAMQSGPRVHCLVPESVAADAIAPALGAPAEPGASITRGHLTLTVVPFLEPDDYDQLLWSCDLNFVRGEDSLVRAHWAGRPFVWQLYPQQARAHQSKLDAFLDIFLRDLDDDNAQRMQSFWQWWNADSPATGVPDWPAICADLPRWEDHARQWARKVATAGELSRSIVEFAGKIR